MRWGRFLLSAINPVEWVLLALLGSEREGGTGEHLSQERVSLGLEVLL